MARKTKEDAEKTRKAIMDAGLKVIYEKGYSRATLNDIANEAGVTRGAFYWHFKDKADLLYKLYEQLNSEMDEILGLWDGEEMVIPDTLEELADNVLDVYRAIETDYRFGTFYKILIQKVEYTEETDAILTTDRLETKRFIDITEKTLASLQENKKIRKEVNIRKTSLGLMALSIGLVEMWMMDSSFIDLSSEGGEILRDYLMKLKA